ncbi:hypothetical protein CDD83_5659 [Cordyceps sp. RAO-2017]|nr:hypothetical protein CDD83_5659 [Cordyceps sp. RAO-2017]
MVDRRIQRFNVQLKTAVEELRSQGLPLSYVDMYSALTLNDLADVVHPNDSGYNKMAQVWMKALRKVLPAPGKRIVQHNPHFQTTHSVPGRSFNSTYIPMWLNRGIVIVQAESNTDLNAVAPYTGHPGISATFAVSAGRPVTVTYRVRDSLGMGGCAASRSRTLKLAFDTDPKGNRVTTGSTSDWKQHTYKFTSTSTAATLTITALGREPNVCGPMIADVVVRQG